MPFQPLRAAAERSDRARALLLDRGRVGDGETAAIALFGAARGARRRHQDLLRHDRRQRRAPPDPRSPPRRPFWRGAAGAGATPAGCGFRGNGRPRRRFAAGKTPARLLLGLTLEIGLLGAPELLLTLARFGGLAFGAFARLAFAAHLRLRLLTATVLFLAGPRVEERARARVALLGCKRRQDDAGLGRGRGRGRPCRRGGGAGAVGVALPGTTEIVGFAGAATGAASPGPRHAAFHLFDHHGFAAPVRKALPHGALLDRPLQMQCGFRRRAADRLVAIARFVHAHP